MKEIEGELWDYYGKPNHVVCITTNATIKADKSIVMGRGCALEAKRRDPALPYLLGDQVKRHGNVPVLVTVTGRDPGYFCSFPVKHQYWEAADLQLIVQSAAHLKGIAEKHPEMTFILPRPGCGNGRRTWAEVKPLLVGLPDNVWVISKGGAIAMNDNTPFVPYEENGKWWYKLPPLKPGEMCSNTGRVVGPFPTEEAARQDAAGSWLG